MLAFLMRLEQICNHPSHWLGDSGRARGRQRQARAPARDAEVIAARQEKALVFTPFREVKAPLATFLVSVFGRPRLVLPGETPVKTRQALVRRFQEAPASSRPVDYRSDHVALGLLIYELAYGTRPFARPSTAQSLAATIEDEPEPIEARNPAVPAHLAAVVAHVVSPRIRRIAFALSAKRANDYLLDRNPAGGRR